MFDATQTRFNVNFVIGDITNGANGNTDTNLSNPTLNIITISPSFLNRSNKMEIGKTILHECIHAYLNAKMVDPTIGTSIPNLNNMEFCDVVNQKYSDFSPGQNQHNFIYNFMLPTMAKVLSEVKEKLVSAEDNTTMNALKMSIPIGSPLTSFDWGGFIHNLSLSGLQNCLFFQKEIGTFNSFGAPITIINQTLMDAYNQYNNFGHHNLHP